MKDGGREKGLGKRKGRVDVYRDYVPSNSHALMTFSALLDSKLSRMECMIGKYRVDCRV